jgi:uncharacterized protein
LKPTKSDLDQACTKVSEFTSFKFTDSGNGGFAGYASVFDVVDKQRERVLRGAFRKHLEDFKRFGFVGWNHDHQQPIGLVKDAREDSRGLWVEGIFHSTPHAQEKRAIVRERLAAGVGVGMSIGYQPVRSRRAKDAVELEELALFETSLLSLPASNVEAGAVSVKSATGGPMNTSQQWQMLREKAQARRDAARGVFDSYFSAIEASREFKEANGIFTVTINDRSVKAAGDPITTGQFSARVTAPAIDAHGFQPSGAAGVFRREVAPTGYLRAMSATAPLSNTSAFIAEASLKPELQPRWAGTDLTLEACAAWVAVTRSALDDLPQLRRAIDTDLQLAIEERLSDRIVNGTGLSPDIKGLIAWPIPTVAFVASSTIPDMIARAVAQVASTGAGTPNFVLMHPNDILAMTIAKVPAAGTYLSGAPLLPFLISDAHVPAGTAIVGDSRYGTIFTRGDMKFIVGHVMDDIYRDKETVVGEIRAALWLSRPGAFAKVALA